MSIYAGTSKSKIKQTAREARALIQDVVNLIDAGKYEAAAEMVHEAAGVAGNLEGEVEAYADEHPPAPMFQAVGSATYDARTDALTVTGAPEGVSAQASAATRAAAIDALSGTTRRHVFNDPRAHLPVCQGGPRWYR